MNTPNVFSFATSELSQDAALAYMLAWASPEYAKTHPALHNLGMEFLRALLDRTAKGAPAKINEVDVKTQENRVDVRAIVNDSIFLLLEDKTNTDRHSNQIQGYVTNAKKKCGDVRPVYVKTGDESKHTRLVTEKICKELGGGHFYRKDLIAVLAKHTKTGNEIIDEFRHHLEEWERKTASFQNASIDAWKWYAHHGYYSAMENEEGVECTGWGYVANPTGGFQCFYGHFRDDTENRCQLYVQIHDSKDLFIRCGSAHDSAGASIKASKKLRNRMLAKVENCRSQFPEMRIEAVAGRAGMSSNIAKIFFDDTDTYMAFKSDGMLDMPATVDRLKKTGELISASCK